MNFFKQADEILASRPRRRKWTDLRSWVRAKVESDPDWEAVELTEAFLDALKQTGHQLEPKQIAAAHRAGRHARKFALERKELIAELRSLADKVASTPLKEKMHRTLTALELSLRHQKPQTK
jgi:hypothetical protein